jgi:uncharacterized protein YdhG (YjbR/CyaY superfamily)
MPVSPADVDAYIESLPAEIRQVVATIRRQLRQALPQSGEVISYQMPTVTIDGRPLVHYAGWKKHVGMYPVPPLDDDLEAEVAPHRSTGSTVRFPYVTPFPYDLIERLVVALAERRSSEAG